MFAEINREALSTLPFVLSTLGENLRQGPVQRTEGNSFHEILWVRRGEGVFRVGQESYILTEGDGFLLRRDVPHSYEGEDFATAWITFRGGDGLLDFCKITDCAVFKVPAFLEIRYRELARLIQSGSTPLARASATYACVTELLGAICTPSEPIEARVENFLEARYGEPLSLDDIAAYAGLDRYALCRYWRRLRGHGVMEDLLRIRIAKAKRFLRYTTDPIEQIGQMCGFESPSYFAKRFREITDCTPAEYRRLHGG